MPPASSLTADRPVPAPPPMIGTPRAICDRALVEPSPGVDVPPAETREDGLPGLIHAHGVISCCETGRPDRLRQGRSYRLGEVGSSLPPSAMDPRIDESAWMFFVRE